MSPQAKQSEDGAVNENPQPIQSARLSTNRNFLLAFAGSSFAGFGDAVFEVTLVLWIATDLAAGRAWSPLAVSGLLVASAAPALVLGPVAGVFADRWNPQRTVVRTRMISAGLVLVPTLVVSPLASFPVAFSPGSRLGVLYLSVVAASSVAQFLAPSSARLLRAIVAPTALPRAAAWSQGAASVTLLAGPALAGGLFVAVGPIGGLLINAGAFAAAAVAALLIQSHSTAETPGPAISANAILGELRDGVRLFRSSPVLVAVAVCMSITVMGASIVAALDVYFVSRNLGASEALYGLLSTAQGFGMIAGAGLAAWLLGRLDAATLMWASVIGLGAILLAYARRTAFWPALAMIALLGVVVSCLPVALTSMVFAETPEAYVGRVVAIFGPLQRLGGIAGLALGGLLYGVVLRDFRHEVAGVVIGPLDTIFSLAGLLCLAGGFDARRRLRKRDPSIPLQGAAGRLQSG